MENKEYENKYNGTVMVLRIIGWPLLIIGISLIVIGFANIFITMTSFDGGQPRLFFLFLW